MTHQQLLIAANTIWVVTAAVLLLADGSDVWLLTWP